MTALPQSVPPEKDSRTDSPGNGSTEIVGDLAEFLDGDGRDEDD
jgi:hypothetical protein